MAAYQEMGSSLFTYGIDPSPLMDAAPAASEELRTQIDTKRRQDA